METAGPTPRAHPLLGRLPEIVRFLLLIMSWTIAVSAALAPIVFLLRRMGVG